VDWACGPDLDSHRNRAARLAVVRGFLAYVRAAEPRTEVPAVGLLRRPPRLAPHIFSDEEIAAVLRAARALGPTGSLRPHTYATLVGLLVSCGLRISEATRLRLDDVRLGATPPHLLIAESKFHKSRLVVLHPTVATGLQAYASKRRRLGYHRDSDTFFVSEMLGPLRAGSARRTFAEIARRAGVRPPKGRGAHLHDLRHTFAVRRMLLWYRDGVDVHARLPELSVYLGHVRPADTYWYLTATPQLLAAAASRFATFAGAGGES
jgi:integrase